MAHYGQIEMISVVWLADASEGEGFPVELPSYVTKYQAQATN